MNPIRYSGVLAFIHWICENHPEIRSLKDTSEACSLNLVTEFEASKGLLIDNRE